MCVAVPMQIVSIPAADRCIAEIGGISREVSLMLLPDAAVGDYVIVHAGFAIERLDEEEAMRTLELFRQLGDILADEPTGHE
ncbi:MAG TPA: HypC/HybG/HupF family hydrogenase formation chaperone [Acidobacteriota bacterium]|nr:HypC/HybG/HupF family hydrogenase formation chaperone [Acidobacteriota bacterium]HOT01901.1 HypC/HybG/HupF family hydrogenase formation chaperone [Acidobacteriota bacterium]HQF87201.1 HypC/HybG/HupF family hydrogenase formation chaperone [Acidobacteriota bacterium]HQG91762.1 HypC/HybG/HupF family hydrogenase formation chaperone [Acidobacteriota bacterium]HQK87825.1 HypC/HybG/HupF family hydrogenase formation chaperone [Acidobacteriota bacterium]